MDAVSLRNLTKSYGSTMALCGLSLDVRHNEFVSLLGHSGCGKTTTLRIVLGFLTPDTGTIRIAGKEMIGVSPRRRGIGMVFQSYALWPHMTVFENIAFGLRVRATPEPEIGRRVDEMIERLRLGGLAQRFPGQLSGGQQQRVALARALIIRPPLLLLDEPLSNLDRQLREDMRLELKHLQRTFAQTTIYVTHDQEEALSLSDRIVVMNNGMIEQVGTPHDVYFHPASQFVARFIGKGSFLKVTIAGLSAAEGVLILSDGKRVAVPDLRGTDSFRAGETAILAARPEEIAFVPDGVGAPPGALEARMFEHLFLGQVQRYQLKLDAATDLFVDSRSPVAADADGMVRVEIKGGCLVRT
ncbi:MAG: ABC transporter ATP-binding protein [Pseudomonadota bacterium]